MIETPAEILAHHASLEAANSFVAWRKTIKKPLSETAAIRIAKTLASINAAGVSGKDGTDALGMAEERGWQSIKEEWYFGQQSRNDTGASRTDATDRQIAFAARASRSPGRDCF